LGAPGINGLARDGQDAMRWNLLHPDQPPRIPYVTACLEGHPGPVVAATDYMKLYAEQLRPFIPRRYWVLGTDGLAAATPAPNCGNISRWTALCRVSRR
jgi:pyruvate dehydrogenase E1 component